MGQDGVMLALKSAAYFIQGWFINELVHLSNSSEGFKAVIPPSEYLSLNHWTVNNLHVLQKYVIKGVWSNPVKEN